MTNYEGLSHLPSPPKKIWQEKMKMRKSPKLLPKNKGPCCKSLGPYCWKHK